MALLEVDNLSIAVARDGRLVPVVRGISFEIDSGHTLGIVGESGCGKSLASLAIMGLTGDTPVRITDGAIRFKGLNLSTLDPAARRRLMGDQIAMIFQEPMTSLNPVYRVGDQIAEAVTQTRRVSRRAANMRVLELLDLVRIPAPRERQRAYPHQLSGGMRQRVMIAIALARDPALLIADEPTTALDVTVQAQILALLLELQESYGMALILISHDLCVIAETCDKVAVMYRGRIVEAATTADIFAAPRHPYTLGLMRSIPDPDADLDTLPPIPGRVPTIEEVIAGCDFHPRCPYATGRCRRAIPDPSANGGVFCHFPRGAAA